MNATSLTTLLIGILIAQSSLAGIGSGSLKELGRAATTTSAIQATDLEGDDLNIGEEEKDELFSEKDEAQVNAFEEAVDEWKESNPEVIQAGGGSNLTITVNQRTQRMEVRQNGKLKFGGWKVSTGMKSLGKTPNGTFTPFEMNRNYRSKRFNVILPNGIKFSGGNLIHAASPGGVNYLGQARSHGCIRLHPTHAKQLFDLVKQVGMSNTRVVVHN